MQKLYFSVLAVALAMAPLAYAHNPAGTPNLACEDPSEWKVHDYGAPAGGFLISGFTDGNMADCDGDFNPNDPYCVAEEVWREDLNGDTLVCEAADYDGHQEYSRGGAWILAEDGTGVASVDPNEPAGSLYCFGAASHHEKYGPFTVQDIYFGSGVEFQVAADTLDLIGDGEGCGDLESDAGAFCVDTCEVTFPPGLDGSYQVYVTGVQGHVITA